MSDHAAVDIEAGSANRDDDSKRHTNTRQRRATQQGAASLLAKSDNASSRRSNKKKDDELGDSDEDSDEWDDDSCEAWGRQCCSRCARNCMCVCITKEGLRIAFYVTILASAVFCAFVMAVVLYLIATNQDNAVMAKRVLVRSDYITGNLSDSMPAMLESVNLTLQTVAGAPQQALSVLNNTAHVSQHLKEASDIWMPLITDILHAVATITPEDMEQLKQHFDRVLQESSTVLEQASKSNMTQTIRVWTQTLNLALDLAARWKHQGGLGLGLGLYSETLGHLIEDSKPPDEKKRV